MRNRISQTVPYPVVGPLFLAGLIVVAVLPGFAGTDLGERVHVRIPPDLGETLGMALLGQAPMLAWAVVASLGISLLLFLPGFLLSLLIDKGRGDFSAWLLRGFVLGLTVVPITAAILSALAGTTIRGMAFAGLLTVLCAATFALIVAADRKDRIAWSMFTGRRADLVASLLVPLAVLLSMLPKFFWESLNSDGAHLLLTAKWMVENGLPFWPESGDPIAYYPGITTITEIIPPALFVRLLGPFALVARISVLPGLALLTLLVLDLCRRAPDQRLPVAQVFVVGFAIWLYAWVLGWFASYSPYFADIAQPLGREPYVAIALLGYALSLRDDRLVWTILYAGLLYISTPSAPMLLGITLAALTLATRPWQIRKFLLGCVLILGVIVTAKMVQYGLVATGLAPPTDEFGAANLLKRLRYVTFDNVERMLFWMLPCGIVPALALLFFPAQDRFTRALALLTLFYVAFFYVQAYRILPHHFSPAMILPVIVFWRMDFAQRRPVFAAGAAAVGLAFATLLSLPRHYMPELVGRQFAASIHTDGEALTRLDPQEIGDFHALIDIAFPMRYGNGEWQSYYLPERLGAYVHAHQPKPTDAQIVYHLRKADDPAPKGGMMIAAAGTLSLYTSDHVRYQADVVRAGLPTSISPLFFVQREVIFGRGPDSPRKVHDLAEIVGLR